MLVKREVILLHNEPFEIKFRIVFRYRLVKYILRMKQIAEHFRVPGNVLEDLVIIIIKYFQTK